MGRIKTTHISSIFPNVWSLLYSRPVRKSGRKEDQNWGHKNAKILSPPSLKTVTFWSCGVLSLSVERVTADCPLWSPYDNYGLTCKLWVCETIALGSPGKVSAEDGPDAIIGSTLCYTLCYTFTKPLLREGEWLWTVSAKWRARTFSSRIRSSSENGRKNSLLSVRLSFEAVSGCAELCAVGKCVNDKPTRWSLNRLIA